MVVMAVTVDWRALWGLATRATWCDGSLSVVGYERAAEWQGWRQMSACEITLLRRVIEYCYLRAQKDADLGAKIFRTAYDSQCSEYKNLAQAGWTCSGP